nr:MAG TPA: hypothetical protein [Caudoviricetes sp.]
MISVSINIFNWRKFVMYKSMKILITRHFYKTAEQAQNKLDVFFAVNRLTDEEYTELTALVETVYGADAAAEDSPEAEA